MLTMRFFDIDLNLFHTTRWYTFEVDALKALFENPTLDDAVKVAEVIKVYDKLKIKEITQAEIKIYFETGLQHLSKVKADIFRKGLLKSFVTNLMQREH